MTRPEPHEDANGAGRRSATGSSLAQLPPPRRAGPAQAHARSCAPPTGCWPTTHGATARGAGHATRWLRSMLDAHDDARGPDAGVSAGDTGHE